MKTKLVLFAAMSTLAGCRGCTTGTGTNTPDFSVTPTALELQACPTKDETGNPVSDVFPAEEKVLVRNNGKAAGQLVLSFTGDDKGAFSVGPTADLSNIVGSTEREVPIRFSPSRKGDLRAELVVDDGNADTKEVKVTLVGIGKNLAANPRIQAAPQNKDDLTKYPACQEGLYCEQVFPDTLNKEASFLEIKLRNIGCPALKITGLEIIPSTSGSPNLAFFIDQPAVPPSASTPLILTEGVNGGETVVKIRFAPEVDANKDTQRFSFLRVTTNDPANPVYDIGLAGAAVQPDLYANPTFCDFTNGPCGTKAVGAAQGTFELKNDGSAPIEIEKIEFASTGNGSSGSNGRFTIAGSLVGQVIQPTSGAVNLMITHVDAPLYVIDQLTITAKVVGGTSGTGGRVIITTAGGKLPCLETDPADTLSFQDPTTELSAKEVTIRNKNDPACGELVVGKLATDTSPFFSLIDPTVSVGTRLTAGQSSTATVQYKKPISGGTQAGVLRIPTNDPNYPLTGKVLYLYSNSPLNQLPVAVAEGCLPSDTTCAMAKATSMSVQLSQLSPKAITITGKSSYDPGNASPTAITKYQFRLVRKPTNAAGASLANDGVKITSKQTTLTLDPAALGLYQVTLIVTDDSGQDSAIASDLKINVNP